ncbi:MAG: AGE family epimerase/isomerase [Anaerolineae bacterium]|jgi:mannobiose 2-epimerase|nr:AGE family epimerase/isomerase [Anaerolineae bacterium]MDH7473351.1 AGE family epimerase/isomerase [Anaerolineae bacterium]
MVSSSLPFNKSDFRQQLEAELVGNILPFWMTHVVDEVNGGFYGAVDNDLRVHNEVPRSAILCARILWTYATAYRILGVEQYLSLARRAYDYLTNVFGDQEYGGLYWAVDYKGSPVFDRKHHYAQAFGIYALSEYYRATQEPQSLMLAQTLFRLLEKYAYDAVYQGYIEGRSRAWETLTDMRLSDREPNCRKSMNTMLHILEAYSNLLRVWDDAHLKAQHRALLTVFLQHILDQQTGHFKLFFDDQWRSLSENVSFGHDIEGSWLLWEAAELQGDPPLSAQARESAISMAAAVYREGLDEDGSLFYESGPQGLVDTSKAWWAQAEAVVGFYNAYQLSGQEHFAQAAYRCWTYIQAKMVDRHHGDWFKRLHRDGTPDHTSYKAGPWECPYHHSRACFEMLARLSD